MGYWIWGEAPGREAPQGALAGAGGEAPGNFFVFLNHRWYKIAIENDILDQIASADLIRSSYFEQMIMDGSKKF